MDRDYSIREADTGHFTAGREDSLDELVCGQPFRDPSVRPRAWGTALAVILAAILAIWAGPNTVRSMMAKTRGMAWKTPEGYALQADRRAHAAFPDRLHGTMAIEIEADFPFGSVLTADVKEFSRSVEDRLAKDARVSRYRAAVVGYFTDVLGFKPPERMMRDMLVSKDERKTLLLLQPTKMEGSWSDVQSFLDELCFSPPRGYSVYITGMPALATGEGCFTGMDPNIRRTDPRDMNFEDLFKAELCAMPVAILIIGCMVRYLWLLLLPLLTLCVSFIVGAAVVVPFMDTVHIPKDVPAAMISVTMALSLDYSLFLLTRFSEHHSEGWPLQRNIDTLVKCTGRTITASGILIAIAFFGTVVLAEENLRGAGVCLGIAAVACMVTSIALIPAVLLITARLFTKGCTVADVKEGLGTFAKTCSFSADLTSQAGEDCSGQKAHDTSKVMKFVERSPFRAISIVTLLMLPFLSYLPELNISADRFAILAMDMPAVTALRHIEQSFPTGFLDPYVVLITAPLQNTGVDEAAAEIHAGLAGLQPQHLKAVAVKLGLDSDAAEKAAAAFSDLARGRDLDTAELEGLVQAIGMDHTTLASVAAGVTVFRERTSGASVALSMKAALRAAKEAGGSSDDLKQAVAAAAAILYGGTPEHKGAVMEIEVREAVRKESEKVGLSSKMAREVADAAAEGARGTVEHLPLAAARAGVRSALSKLRGSSDARSLRDALYEIEDIHLSSVDIAKVLRATSASMRKAQEETGELAEDGSSAGRPAAEDAINDAAKDDRREDVEKINKKNVQEGLQQSSHGLSTVSADLGREVRQQALKQGLSKHAASVIAAAAMAVTNTSSSGVAFQELRDDWRAQAGASTSLDKMEEILADGAEKAGKTSDQIEARAAHQGLPFVIDMIDTVYRLSRGEHGTLLMPTGYDAMLALCHAIDQVGHVSSLLGPTWALRMEIDWVTAVAWSMDAKLRHAYQPLMESHVNGNQALLEVHTTFPSVGAGGADWVLAVREVLQQWEASHPGWKAELSGGASAAADTRTEVMQSLTRYLWTTISLILVVFFITFRSLLMPLRLFIALVFTLSATFGTAVIVYQTPLMHNLFPCLAPFNGLCYEVVPIATGIAIALGLDYDVFLVSRVVEFRMAGYSDRLSIFRGAVKTSGVICSAGVIMVLAFSGLCFANKLLLQQFGVLLIVSVLYDCFVVRTILVPALMLMAREWNWWPRRMPPAVDEESAEEETIKPSMSDVRDREEEALE